LFISKEELLSSDFLLYFCDFYEITQDEIHSDLAFILKQIKPFKYKGFVVFWNIYMHKKYPKMSTNIIFWMLLPYISLFWYKND